MIADQRDDLAALGRSLALEAHQVADDLQAVRTAIDNVTDLDEGRLAACPAAVCVNQPRGAGDRPPSGVIPMKIADRDDARCQRLRRGKRRRGARKQRGEKHQ